MNAAERAVEHNRLRWRCRRGMLELDLLLLPFVEQRFWSLSLADQALFRDFLEEDDPNLYDWFNGRSLPTDPAALRLVEMIRGRA